MIVHAQNRGVGAAIATGYARALALGAEATAVMAGDGQMDPADLPRLLAPIVDGAADYAKGNRFAWPGGWRQMPPVRLAGSVALSWLTRAASGYWRLFDSQCGYTVASRRALSAIGPERMFARYGYPNDLLARLGAAGARVVDVPVRPVYGPAWRSGLRPSRIALPLAWLLLRAFVRRVFVARVLRRRCARDARPARLRPRRLLHIGLLTTSFPRHAGDYAGSFVGDRAAAAARRRGMWSRCWRRARPAMFRR